VNINEQKIRELISRGEGITTEFKECRGKIGKSTYETVCAFLNRHGGTLLLGGSDDGEIKGIAPELVKKLRKDFINSTNDPDKINPRVQLTVNEVNIDGRVILHVFVPESREVHRCNGRVYDRNEDGDYDITSIPRRIATLYRRKDNENTEDRVYPFTKIEELRIDLIEYCRRVVSLRRKDHPWAQLDTLELLKSAQLYRTDSETGRSGITLAGILLFGTDQQILSIVSHHRTDLLVRKVNIDRYDDRDFVATNLIESYSRIMAFVAKHLPDPFHLEGDIRISLRDLIFHEIASNILVHREYRYSFPARLIIERDRVIAENGNNPVLSGAVKLSELTPHPKNPVIAQFFREIGRADELGSGVRNLAKYCKLYGGTEPEVVDGDIFQIVLKYPDLTVLSQPVTPSVTPSVIQLLETLEERGPLGNNEIREVLGLKDRKGIRKRYTQPALEDQLIEMTIPDKPQSRNQQYRLTEKGRRVLQQIR
jgi:ATP-dependent DNA helicase RecG